MAPAHLAALDTQGFAIRPAAISDATLQQFRDEAARLSDAEPDHAHGIRHLLQRSPLFAAWAHSKDVLALLPPGMQVVRAILFDKTPETNWKVPWHQDLTIAVAEKADVPGYGPWSVKDGVVHVQPPIAVLEQMITLRLHLDDTPASNGALRVILGSHKHGRLSAPQIIVQRETTPEHTCAVAASGLLFMKPLILHASSASTEPSHRRVVHLEYAPVKCLHSALCWAEGAIAYPQD